MEGNEANSHKYNYIYSKLVQDQNDILGVIAYSIYKRHKIEFITSVSEKEGRDPTDEEFRTFREVTNNQTQLDMYKDQAKSLSQSFLDAALEEEAEEISNFYSNKAESEIRQMKPQFMFGVWQGVVASFLFVFIMGILVFFTWSLNQGPKQVIENIFKIRIESVEPPLSASQNLH